jgi:hypothetical protein
MFSRSLSYLTIPPIRNENFADVHPVGDKQKETLTARNSDERFQRLKPFSSWPVLKK